jgi:eukaryotic-like serine/threonine-protein kinase
VLRQDIDWQQLPPSTPAEVRRLLRRCLERDPRNRLHDIADARLMLQDALAGRVDAPADATAGLAPPTLAARLAPWLAAAAVVALLVASWLAWRAGHRAPVTPHAARPVSFQQLTDAPGVESSPSLAPDGKSFVYVGRVQGVQKLYLQRVGGRNATLLDPVATADDWQPAFSPDGEQIAFRSERDGGGIFVMGSTGESVRRLTDFGFNPSWSPDGREIVVANGTYLSPTELAARASGLVAVEVASGRRRIVSQAANAMRPSWSPHGRRIAFWGMRKSTVERDLFTVAADGSESDAPPHEATHDAALDWSPIWSPDGKWLWFSSNRGGTMNLWRLPIDEASGRPLGEPEPMTTPSLWSSEISFARDGSRVAYASLIWRSTLLRVGFDPQQERVVGAPVRMLGSTQPIRDHETSPDGQWVALMLTGTQEDVVIARLDGTEYRRGHPTAGRSPSAPIAAARSRSGPSTPTGAACARSSPLPEAPTCPSTRRTEGE